MSLVRSLAHELLELEARYRTSTALSMDPIHVVLDYSEPKDREVAAWIAAQLAYGRVQPMLVAIRKALAPLGPKPSAFLQAHRETHLRRVLSSRLQDWVWRFQTSEDLIQWMLAWKRLDGEGGLEAQLQPSSEADADQRLSTLVQRLRRELPSTHGLRFFLPDPMEGAACKRWRLFLRWMVRQEWPDLGLWKDYPRTALVIPLDTHVARISRLLGLTSRNTPDGRMAQDITHRLAKLDPHDPLRFDFAISHLGILGDCPLKADPLCCQACPLRRHCREGKRIKSTS